MFLIFTMGPYHEFVKKAQNFHIFSIFFVFLPWNFFFLSNVSKIYCKKSPDNAIFKNVYLVVWSRDNIKKSFFTLQNWYQVDCSIYGLIKNNYVIINITFKMLKCFSWCSINKFLFWKSIAASNKLANYTYTLKYRETEMHKC